MILEKIEHYLKLSFLLLLVITQAMVFVAVRAAGEDNNLQAVFVNPISGQQIQAGELVDIQAMLSTEADTEFSTVDFTIIDVSRGQDLSFEAYLNNDGIWKSSSSWNTENWPAGTYYIYATAKVYEANILQEVYQSIPQAFELIGDEYQIAAEGDITRFLSPVAGRLYDPDVEENIDIILETSWQEDTIDQLEFIVSRVSFPSGGNSDPDLLGCMDQVLTAERDESNATSTNVLYTATLDIGECSDSIYSILPVINSGFVTIEDLEPVLLTVFRDAPVEDLISEFEVLQPSDGDVLSGTTELVVDIGSDLPEDTDIKVDFRNNTFGSVAASYYMVSGSEPRRRSLTVDTTTTMPSEQGSLLLPVFIDGEYDIIFQYQPEGSATFVNLDRITVEIINLVEDDPEEYVDPQITLINPLEGSVITDDILLINFETNFEAEVADMQVVNSEDPSIGTAITGLSNVDGYHWTYSFGLPEQLIDGDYFVDISALPLSQEPVEAIVSRFEISLQREGPIFEPETVNLDIFNVSSNVSGQVSPIILSNLQLPAGDIILEISSTIPDDPQTIEGLNAIGIEWNSVAGLGLYPQDYPDTPFVYLSSFDSSLLNNGNYNLAARSTSYPDSPSETITISVFNEGNDNNLLVPPGQEVLLETLVPDAVTTAGEIVFITSSNFTNIDNLVLFIKNTVTNEIIELPLEAVATVHLNEEASFQNIYSARINVEDVLLSVYELYAQCSYNDFTGQEVIATSNLVRAVLGEFNTTGPQMEVADYWVDESGVLQLSARANFSPEDMLNVSFVVRDKDTLERVDEQPFVYSEDTELYNVQWPSQEGKYILGVRFTTANNGEQYMPRMLVLEVSGDGLELQEINDEVEEVVPEEEQEEPNEQVEEPQSDSSATVISPVVIGLYSTCVDVGITDEATCLKFRATMDLLDDACIEQEIYDPAACEDYLNRTQIDMECQAEGIIDPEQCKDYLLEKYGSEVDCQLGDLNLCMEILRDNYLSRLVIGQKQRESLEEAVRPYIGQVISTEELNNALISQGVSEEVLPVEPSSEVKVLLAESKAETVLEDRDRLTVIGQAVLVVDTDADGLTDDLEEYYGTDPLNPDTDADGYLDGTEVSNNYNPLGEGALETERSDFDRAILAKAILEQPKAKSSKVDKRLAVNEVGNDEDKLKLSGKAEADSWVTLFLYSDLPLVMVTKTDSSGNWSYDVKHSLADGHHRVYVTVNDSTGKIVKQSQPVSFLVKKAQAVTANDYFDDTTTSDKVESFLIYYILGAAFLIFLALGVILLLHKDRKPDLEI